LFDARDKRLRVVFLDRDGVINRNRDDYVKSVDEFELIPGALEGIRELNQAGWKVVVISNQACVGKGILSDEALAEIDSHMVAVILRAGGQIEASYYCVHTPDEGCDCRKPEPGLILKAGRELGFDPKGSVFVGDAAGDVLAGRLAGCRTVVVLCGRTSPEAARAIDPAPDYIAADLKEAVGWITSAEN
jgi:histidinol-phosphate phosphatase family protein